MDRLDSSSASPLPLIYPGARPGAKKAKAREKAGASPGAAAFSEILENSIPEDRELGPVAEFAPSEEALTELLDAVHSAGSDLKERPLSGEILRYKRAVRNFINYVLENGYEMERIQGAKRKAVIRGKTEWKEKVYCQVRIIDQKMDELAAAILSGQAGQLAMVAKMDEITGLLVDLTVTGAIKERQ